MAEYQNEAQRRRKARLAKKARAQRRRRLVTIGLTAVLLVALDAARHGKGAAA